MHALLISEVLVVKQLTVRGVDESLDRWLRDEARRRGVSVNRAVLQILEQATGTRPPAAGQPEVFNDLDFLAGTWSDEDVAEFNRATADLRQIEPDFWR